MTQHEWQKLQFNYHSEIWHLEVRQVKGIGPARFEVFYQPDGHDELRGNMQLQSQGGRDHSTTWFQLTKQVGDVLLNEDFVRKIGEEIESGA